MIITLVFFSSRLEGGKPQSGVEYGRNWITQNLVVGPVFCFVIVNAEHKECIEDNRFLSQKNVANYAAPKESKIEIRKV